MTDAARAVAQSAAAAAALGSALAYPFLPQRAATHFDAEGEPDRFSSRRSTAVTFPAIMVGLSLLYEPLGRWPGSRDREDTTAAVEAESAAVASVNLAFLTLHLALLARALGLRFDLRRVEDVVYGAVLMSLGNVLPKLPRNGVVGIRTPWTLADPTVWERTHRLGGYLLTGAGIVTVVTSPFSGARARRIALGATRGAIGVSAAYSFAIYVRRNHVAR